MGIVAQIEGLYREILAGLEPEELAAVAGVRLVVKARPDRLDRERGCTARHRAAFWGIGRQLGLAGETELPDPSPASGEIVLFLDNLQPLNRDRLTIAIRHELAHALGYEEEEIQAAGLILPEGPPCQT